MLAHDAEHVGALMRSVPHRLLAAISTLTSGTGATRTRSGAPGHPEPLHHHPPYGHATLEDALRRAMDGLTVNAAVKLGSCYRIKSSGGNK
jgi:hypothetical protein